MLGLDEVREATGGVVVAEPRAALAFSGVSIDSRSVAAGQLFVAIVGPRFDGHDFVAEALRRGAAAALVQRDVPGARLPLIRVADTTRALGDLGRFVRQASPAKVVGITGSAGKTTTKEMTAALLARSGPVLKTEGNLNNRYGLPLSLLRLQPAHRYAVLEMGMSAAGELRGLTDVARPDVAVITNVAAVHLEFFDSVDAIADAKAEILEGVPPGGAAVLNRDDTRLRRVGEAWRGPVIWFGSDRACDVSAERWRGTVHGMRFSLRLGGRTLDVALPLAGRHQAANFIAAAAVAHHLGVDPEAIVETAATLAPAAHRGQVLALREGVTLIDDAYNSNPVATEAAVGALRLAPQGRRVAFLGDMLELGPGAAGLHRETGARIAHGLDLLVAVGPLARGLLEGARAAGADPGALVEFADSAAAAAAAPGLVRKGDAVLVKGSRGARMERVVEALVASFGGEDR
jgi:UDP-N-acetylmuramoyl-tripeptide--D-alanyl-D-alanine ligase